MKVRWLAALALLMAAAQLAVYAFIPSADAEDPSWLLPEGVSRVVLDVSIAAAGAMGWFLAVWGVTRAMRTHQSQARGRKLLGLCCVIVALALVAYGAVSGVTAWGLHATRVPTLADVADGAMLWSVMHLFIGWPVFCASALAAFLSFSSSRGKTYDELAWEREMGCGEAGCAHEW